MRNKAFLFENKAAFIQYIYIYVMMSSAGMALPSFIGNDRFIILVLMMGIFYVFFKPSVSRLQKSYLTFIGVFFISMLLVVVIYLFLFFIFNFEVMGILNDNIMFCRQ